MCGRVAIGRWVELCVQCELDCFKHSSSPAAGCLRDARGFRWRGQILGESIFANQFRGDREGGVASRTRRKAIPVRGFVAFVAREFQHTLQSVKTKTD